MVNTFYKIRENSFFQAFVIGVIIFSALLVGSTTYDVDPQFSKILSYLDYAVTIFFVVELSIRFLGEEIKSEFLKDGWNLFDTIIVTVSLIPMGAGNSALLLRLLRIFRVLRLISFIPELRILIESLLKSLPRIGYVCLLLFIIIYIYMVKFTLILQGLIQHKGVDTTININNIINQFHLFSYIIISTWQSQDTSKIINKPNVIIIKTPDFDNINYAATYRNNHIRRFRTYKSGLDFLLQNYSNKYQITFISRTDVYYNFDLLFQF